VVSDQFPRDVSAGTIELVRAVGPLAQQDKPRVANKVDHAIQPRVEIDWDGMAPHGVDGGVSHGRFPDVAPVLPASCSNMRTSSSVV